MGQGVRGRVPAARTAGGALTDPALTDPALVFRLRAAGCVFAEDEARLLLEAADGAELERLVQRRVAGEPLEYVLGWVEFDGFRYAVEPGVFVPRQRSELTVARAAELAARFADPVVVDLCCGNGALGAAVLRRLGTGRLLAADVDATAVRCAERNVGPVGGIALLGDLFAPLPDELRGRVDVLVAHVPYVPTDAIALMPPEAREHEPHTSLDGGPDGLRLFARVAAEAPAWLSSGGCVLMETSTGQVPAAQASLQAAGLDADVAVDDETGATVVLGTSRRTMAS